MKESQGLFSRFFSFFGSKSKQEDNVSSEAASNIVSDSAAKLESENAGQVDGVFDMPQIKDASSSAARLEIESRIEDKDVTDRQASDRHLDKNINGAEGDVATLTAGESGMCCRMQVLLFCSFTFLFLLLVVL